MPTRSNCLQLGEVSFGLGQMDNKEQLSFISPRYNRSRQNYRKYIHEGHFRDTQPHECFETFQICETFRKQFEQMKM